MITWTRQAGWPGAARPTLPPSDPETTLHRALALYLRLRTGVKASVRGPRVVNHNHGRMLTVASLLAAMTIAGAFWVGVLAARRLRDWGEGRRALEDGGPQPLAIAAAGGSPPDDPRSRRIREAVAERLRQQDQHRRGRAGASVTPPRPGSTTARSLEHEDLGLATLRSGDVVSVESGDARCDGDYIVDGLLLLREGGTTTTVVTMADGSRRRWLVGSPHAPDWYVLEPVRDHGLSGEPPRNIRRERGDYGLTRRGQASAAGSGGHGRPDLPRAATYLYTAMGRDVLWLERWGSEVFMGEGRAVDPSAVSFLPGS